MDSALCEQRWSAMGGRAQVVLVGGSRRLIALAETRVAFLEARWSRFLPDSDITTVNRRRGDWVEVSAETVTLIDCLLRAREFTGAAFEPFLLDAVELAGYDRSYDELPDEQPASGELKPPGRPVGEAPIDVDHERRQVRLTGAQRLDPGGLGKGLAADLVTADLVAAGAAGAMVNLGGDLRVRGAAPVGRWRVGIDDPRDQRRTLFSLLLDEGAVATSSRLRRTWTVDGQPKHHLIDPATGDPAETGVVAVTVLAGECWWAEALTKAAFLAGPEGGVALLEAAGVHGTVIDDADGRHDTSGFAGSVR